MTNTIDSCLFRNDDHNRLMSGVGKEARVRDSSGKPTARDERGLVTDSPTAPQAWERPKKDFYFTGNA